MRYPMILPWLARKAGVSLPAARRLWDLAIAESDRRFAPNLRGSAYWAHALADFRRRLEGPSRRHLEPQVAGIEIGGLLWIQGRVLGEAMAAWAGFLAGACAAWPRLVLARLRMP
jgi:hypothetical protein